MTVMKADSLPGYINDAYDNLKASQEVLRSTIEIPQSQINRALDELKDLQQLESELLSELLTWSKI